MNFQVPTGRGVGDNAERYRRMVEAFALRVMEILESDAEARFRLALKERVLRPSAPPRAGRRASGGAPTQLDIVIAQTKQLIEAKYASRTLTLDNLARRAGVSKFYLARTFQAKVGKAIHQYIVDMRVARARELLALGKRPSRVWRTAGFADQPHMTRTFRKRLGKTPKSFYRGLRWSTG